MELNRPRLGRLAAGILAAALALSVAGPAAAQFQREEKAKVELLADRASYALGSSARVAVMLAVEDGWHINSDHPTLDYLIPTQATLILPEGWPEARLTYPQPEMLSFSFVDEPIAVFEGRVAILADLEIPADASGDGGRIRAEVRYQACNDSQCLPPVTSAAEVILPFGEDGPPINQAAFGPAPPPGLDLVRSTREGETAPATAAAPPATAGAAGSAPGAGFLGTLLIAVLGGLILNVMPCVLPVLSLKVFGLVKSAHGGRGEVVRGSLMTALGILVSFWALAGAAVLARTAGQAVGWGVQFQEPGFVAFLAVVVVLFSLNLWGVFEIPLPARLANRLTGGGSGMAGHFGSGLFATLMATPCSAPFLGTAVSFALGRSAPQIFAVFTAIGVGMALPFLALAVAPQAAGLLPKPGAWMDTLRGLMGFLLAAAAIWLFFVLAAQVPSERLALIQLAMLALALFVWLGARGRESGHHWATTSAALACAAVAVFLATSASTEAGPIEWRPYDEAEAVALAESGHPVFVDVTAEWCLTCKANEKLVLAHESVTDAFTENGVVAMKADWTNYDDAITALLERYGRSGIPFYMLYRPGAEPHVFGELLTRGAVVEAVSTGAGTAGTH
ncbi:MAG: thioredoxin family protein [Acidobacteria bacterium]|nr:thioredoxin family protein [Acidobacteriota bacterium]